MDALKKEIEHLQKVVVSYPSATGSFYTADLLHEVDGVASNERRRVFAIEARETDRGRKFNPFYLLLETRRAALFLGELEEEPPSERTDVWLCLEHLLSRESRD